MRIPIAICFVLFFLHTPSALAQIPLSKPTGSARYDRDGNLVTASFTFRVPPQPPVAGFLAGRPYSADEISQRVQILPDGTRIVRSGYTGRFYRDSAGRTRTEQRLPPPPTAEYKESPAVPEIFDPVAGCIYYLDVAKKIAHRVTLPQPLKALTPPQGLVFPMNAPVMAFAPQGQAPAPAPEKTGEQLGIREIEGIEVRGTRTTTVYPIGSMGNDRPLTATTENWVSLELNAVISSKISDPRQWESIYLLTNISRQEPDASLFQVPPGYEVIDETGPFTITIEKSGAN